MKIETLDELRSILGAPNPVLEKKIYTYLNPRMLDFIQHAPLVLISTVDSDGVPTISPKGDHPGFVVTEGNSKLQIPERKGNKLAYSLANILNGSKVALLFIVPGTHEVLRVQGQGELINDPELNQKLASGTQKALLATQVSVDSCYFHCGKALLRSKLFSSDIELRDMNISFGLELSDNGGLDASDTEKFDNGVRNRYQTDL
ncbi:pyridoxamine 5'-phosphate oxidase family protein [Pseudomaricurvus sp.]|uniref:pyridoxamine 5'-phosphate oxidase family protein n=1 Tax=Pseudomaricurvus sp. TaxID=2004510 RepID=UPI003F6B243F